jgi:hypothetical protein
MTSIVCTLLLVLAIDVSNSVDTIEYDAQVRGTAEALASEQVGTIINRMDGGMAVAVVQFGSTAETSIGWRRITDNASRIRVADEIAAMPRSGQMWTSISAAMEESLRLMAEPPCEPERMAIDISGDGINNSGPPIDEWRDRAAALGIQVNGLVILDREPNYVSVEDHYRNHVVTPGGYTEDGSYVFPGFVIVADGYEDYGRAMLMKLRREISDAR